MAHSTRTVPIVIASVIAVLLVGGAYVLSGPIPFINTVGAESTEELLKAYAAKDTDGDGLPDWQEALYGTDPENPQSFQAGMTDGEAVAQGLLTPQPVATAAEEVSDDFPGTDAAPGSLTDQFAKRFFENYLLTRGGTPPSEEQMLSFVQSAVNEISRSALYADAYSSRDMRISANGGKAGLGAYAAASERAFAENTVPADKDALSYFSDAIEGGDTEAYAQLQSMSDAYKGIASAMVEVPVPVETAATHLRIVNSLMHMSRTLADMAAMPTDPLRAMVGIGAYDERSKEMIRAFAALGEDFRLAGVSLSEGEEGFYVYRTSQASSDSAAVFDQKP
ncbi:MAG TPA: thrombospondin type 3 repeat-containing protein [Candidatus Paceibacterota bacterium]|nr:thrombospondin type 3 repeat-containing protein [Candidatus Paceibacterota bacterium]